MSKENYKTIDRDTVSLINEATGSKIKIDEEEEKVNMCQAIEDLKKEAKDQGKILGKEETRISDIKSIVERFGISNDEAMDILKIPVGEREVLKAKIRG